MESDCFESWIVRSNESGNELNKNKVMEQQQKRREKVSRILADDREITIEELLFIFCDQKISESDIHKKLSLIQEAQNNADDLTYELKIRSKRVAALNSDLVLDIVANFDQMMNAPNNMQKSHQNQQNGDQNEQKEEEKEQKDQENQFMDEKESASIKDHSSVQQEQFRQGQSTKPIPKYPNQDPHQLQHPQNSINSPENQHPLHTLPQTQFLIQPQQQQKSFKNIFEPQISKLKPRTQLISEPKQTINIQQPVLKTIKPNSNSNIKILPQSTLKNLPETQKAKTPSKLNQSLSKDKKPQSNTKIPQSNTKMPLENTKIPQSNSKIPQPNTKMPLENTKMSPEKYKPTADPNQNNPQAKPKPNTVFQVNQFSVLDSKKNIEKQKKLLKIKQMQLQKQKKQQQRLAHRKLIMDSQLHHSNSDFDSLGLPTSHQEHQSLSGQKRSNKQQPHPWKSKKADQQNNPSFDNLEENSFESDPEANEQEAEELSGDINNRKNNLNERSKPLKQKKRVRKPNSFESKQYQALKDKLNRYLIPAYYQYVLKAYSTDVIFDKDQIFKKPLMDITLFLKFYKDFNLKDLLKVLDVTKIFKKHSFNHLWLDAENFLQFCYRIVEIKSNQNGKDPIHVNSEDEIIQRSNQFIKAFDKDKVKQLLKITNKDSWDKILDEFQNRQLTPTVQKQHKNKGEVVDKFLERNFDLELPKWKSKKDLTNKPPNNDSRIKAKSKQNLSNKARDQKTISTDIQRLRSQSEKSIQVLKGLFNDKFDQQLRSLVNIKSDTRNTQQILLNSPKNIVNKAPLHKNKNKNTVSAYKQIEQFINQNIKTMKTQKNLLGRNLKINQDEPFLNAYFSREMKSNTSKNDAKNQIFVEVQLSGKNGESSSARLGKANQKPIKSPSSLKNLSSQGKSDSYNIPSGRNEFISLEKLDRMRKNHSNSSPSDPNNKIYKQYNRANSLRKVGLNQKVTEKMSPSESSVVSLPVVKKSVGGGVKLNKVENELINKKLYDFLLNNKEHQNNALSQKISKIIKQNKNQAVKTEGQEIHLMHNYRQEVYELYKNFLKRGKEEEQIVSYENDKRKGYLKNSKVPNSLQIKQ